jgi:hypothetical protein
MSSLIGHIGRPMGGLCSCRVWSQLSYKYATRTEIRSLHSRVGRVRFVYASRLPRQKRLRLCKSELDKKMMLSSSPRVLRGGTQPALSRVTPAWKRHPSTNRHRHRRWIQQFDRSRRPMVKLETFILVHWNLIQLQRTEIKFKQDR